jgi:hypothetical protein
MFNKKIEFKLVYLNIECPILIKKSFRLYICAVKIE